MEPFKLGNNVIASTLCNPCPYGYNCTKCKKETDKLARKLHKHKKRIKEEVRTE